MREHMEFATNCARTRMRNKLRQATPFRWNHIDSAPIHHAHNLYAADLCHLVSISPSCSLVLPSLLLDHLVAMAPTTGGRRPYRLTVRIISVICALSVMAIYSLSTAKTRNHAALVSQQNELNLAVHEAKGAAAPAPGPVTGRRRLFQYSALANSRFDRASDYVLGDSDSGDDDNGSGGDADQDNCTAPRAHHEGYNDSCSFVLDQCQDWVLFDYLRFVLCDLKHVQVA